MEETFKITTKDIDIENPVVVEGFPGVGLIGGIASNYMVEQKEMEQLGYVDSRYLPPVALVKEGLVYPPIRVYKWKNIILFHSDIPIHPQVVHDLSRAMVEWCENQGIERLISLAGVAMPVVQDRIFGAANQQGLLDSLRHYEIEIMKEGAVGGLSGKLLFECKKEELPAFALLAETKGMSPDPRASARVLSVLGEVLEFEIDVEPLIEEAENIEAKMEELARQTRKMKQKEEKPAQVSMYR